MTNQQSAGLVEGLEFEIQFLLNIPVSVYPIAGSYSRVQFLQKDNLQSFHGLIFTDVHDHTHHTLYNRAYFTESSLSMKTAKIGPLKNFQLHVHV